MYRSRLGDIILPEKRTTIRHKLITRKYQDIQELLDELTPDSWAGIWGGRAVHSKYTNPEKLILRDLYRTAAYFGVRAVLVWRLFNKPK